EIEVEETSFLEVARMLREQKGRLNRERGGTHSSSRGYEGNACGPGFTIEGPPRTHRALAGLQDRFCRCGCWQPIGNVEPKEATHGGFIECFGQGDDCTCEARLPQTFDRRDGFAEFALQIRNQNGSPQVSAQRVTRL